MDQVLGLSAPYAVNIRLSSLDTDSSFVWSLFMSTQTRESKDNGSKPSAEPQPPTEQR